MREILPGQLWCGNAKDADTLLPLLNAGVKAVVSLALEELLAKLIREMTYCRFPLVDGEGNPANLLRVAIQTTASLINEGIPTLVSCGSGMSRAPAITAAALAQAQGRPLETCLEEIAATGPCDVSAGLWEEVKAVCEAQS
jgi:hypothetical protein